MTMKDKSNLIWIDLEMTGLDTQRDYIIEIATIVTDKNLNILGEGPNLIIHQIDEVMNNMDDWNTRQHARTGLTKEVKASTINETQAENDTIAFLEEYILKGESPLCGNTICQDRRFLARCMPKLQKNGNHRALGDIRDSIEELKYYRKTIFKL
jgi:oligoribonuclease